VSVALALLTKPRFVILDEPTAGLDSVTAMNLVDTLKDLARNGCTILCVIHQPQKAIFELLDRLILLRSGEIIYDGEAKRSVQHLVSLGHDFDQLSNPADFIMEVISPRLGETYDELQVRCEVKKAYVSPSINLEAHNEHPLPKRHDLPSIPYQFS